MRTALLHVVVAATLLGSSSHATVDPVTRCSAARVRAVAKAFTVKLRCHSDAVLRGSTSEGACLERAQRDLVEAFTRAESRGGCSSGVGATSLGFALDSWVAGAVATFAPPTLPPLGPPTEASLRCARGKIRALSRAFVGKLRCRAAGEISGSDAGACTARVQRALAGAFLRADARGGCVPGVDAATFGVVLGDWATSTLAATGLHSPAPTPAPTPSPAPTASPGPTGGDAWACCAVVHPELGICNGGVTGAPESPLANSFRNFCESQAGTWSQQRCTAAQCGDAALCCVIGTGGIGTSEYFGAPDPAAIDELCGIQGGTVLPGACPP